MSSQSLFSLKDEVAVVTGGAQGLGEQMAIGLAEAGANVIIADLNLDSAKKVAQSLEKYGAKTMAVHVDVTQKPSVENMVDEIVKNFRKSTS